MRGGRERRAAWTTSGCARAGWGRERRSEGSELLHTHLNIAHVHTAHINPTGEPRCPSSAVLTLACSEARRCASAAVIRRQQRKGGCGHEQRASAAARMSMFHARAVVSLSPLSSSSVCVRGGAGDLRAGAGAPGRRGEQAERRGETRSSKERRRQRHGLEAVRSTLRYSTLHLNLGTGDSTLRSAPGASAG